MCEIDFQTGQTFFRFKSDFKDTKLDLGFQINSNGFSRDRSFQHQSYLAACRNSLWPCSNSFKVLSFLEACFDLNSSSSFSMKIQIMGGKITENPGFKSLLRKVKIFLTFRSGDLNPRFSVIFVPLIDKRVTRSNAGILLAFKRLSAFFDVNQLIIPTFL